MVGFKPFLPPIPSGSWPLTNLLHENDNIPLSSEWTLLLEKSKMKKLKCISKQVPKEARALKQLYNEEDMWLYKTVRKYCRKNEKNISKENLALQ